MKQEKKQQKKKARRLFHMKKRTRMQLLAITSLVLLFLIASSFAWYTVRLREGWSREREVMDPYCLYLRDKDDRVSAELSVNNLSSGEVKEIPFCVSNAPNTGSGIVMGGGEFDFDLELIYTENMPLTYRILELRQQDSSKPSPFEDPTALKYEVNGTEVTDIRHGEVFAGLSSLSDIVNKGKYRLYEKEGAAPGTPESEIGNLHLSTGTDGGGGTTYSTRYFLLQITVPEVLDFQKYNKETDVIYIVATAKQPRPVKTGSGG